MLRPFFCLRLSFWGRARLKQAPQRLGGGGGGGLDPPDRLFLVPEPGTDLPNTGELLSGFLDMFSFVESCAGMKQFRRSRSPAADNLHQPVRKQNQPTWLRMKDKSRGFLLFMANFNYS